MKKSLLVFWLILTASFVVIGSILPGVSRVHAEQTGQWIDKVSIIIGNDVYTDSDPWDTRDEYLGAKKAEGCYDHVWIDDMSGTGKKAHVDFYYKNDLGECIAGKSSTDRNNKTETITLSNEGVRWVTAYQKDADTVFLPAYPNYDDMNVKDAIGDGYHTKTKGTFKRLPNDATFCTNDNKVTNDDGPDKGKCTYFVRISNGAPDAAPGNYTVWVDTQGAPKVLASLCPPGAALGKCKILNNGGGKPLTFANNRVFTTPDPKAGYEVGAQEPGSDSGTAKPTCEANNGTIVIGWLVCGFLGILDNAVDKSTDTVESLLDVKTDDLTQGDSAAKLKSAWSVFRILSSVSLLAVALIMIIGQAIGGE